MDFNSSWFILPAAFALDIFMGDPRWLPHPVRWMGAAIDYFETRFRDLPISPVLSGTLFAGFLVALTWLASILCLQGINLLHPYLKSALEVILIYYCISAGSLEEAARQIHSCFLQKNVDDARKNVTMIVGRDVAQYGKSGITRATVETVAENLVDGVISPLFFAAIGGAPLALAYKMVNTLDSMVGYKNDKYLLFGKASARIDDLLNYIPARLSVPIIALAATVLTGGHGMRSFKTAVVEGRNHSSPNAGYPEAAFAGALAVKLNGPNYYAGVLVDKPYIGIKFGNTECYHIKQACDLMMLSSLLWLFIAWVAYLLLDVAF